MVILYSLWCEAGHVTELAWPICDYTDMLLERDETGDQQKATGMLGEATGMSTDLGMRSFTLMERGCSKLDIPKA